MVLFVGSLLCAVQLLDKPSKPGRRDLQGGETSKTLTMRRAVVSELLVVKVYVESWQGGTQSLAVA